MVAIMATMHRRDDDPSQDTDISGPGVIIGAMLANLLTMFSTIISLRVGYRKRRQRREEKLMGLRLDSWSEVLPEFVLSLSDQQLLTGLVLLAVGLGTFYNTSVHKGANNLWVAGDIVVFSSVTHAATLVALRSYFRKHRILALIRVCMMWMTFGLYIVVAHGVLSKAKPKHSAKLPFWLAEFWQGATYIDLFGVTYMLLEFALIADRYPFVLSRWMYLITYLPIFISDKAAEVRELIASDAKMSGNISQLEEWDLHTQLRRRNTRELHFSLRTLKNVSPYKILRSKISALFKRFTKHYLQAEGRWYRRFLWLMAEFIFPWRLTIVPVTILWGFGFATMILNLWQSDDLGDWDFGQLISPIFTIMPVYNLIVAITQVKKEEHEGSKPASISDLEQNTPVEEVSHTIITSKEETVELRNHDLS